jgi:putative endonuclease
MSDPRSKNDSPPAKTMERLALGKWGESLASDYLRKRGYLILERNVRTPYGEIDLVTRQSFNQDGLQPNSSFPRGPVTVFVEVKTRRSEAFGLPEEAITSKKKAHLLSAAQSYLQSHPEFDGDWRIDVIAIQRLSASREPSIVHFENAVT